MATRGHCALYSQLSVNFQLIQLKQQLVLVIERRQGVRTEFDWLRIATIPSCYRVHSVWRNFSFVLEKVKIIHWWKSENRSLITKRKSFTGKKLKWFTDKKWKWFTDKMGKSFTNKKGKSFTNKKVRIINW